MYSIDIEAMTSITQETLVELTRMSRQIPELRSGLTQTEFNQRMAEKHCLILLARVEGEIAGFKLGYALEEGVFYSWLGGVLPDFRNLGLAGAMLRHQEVWARQRGFHQIRVKTRNHFKAMLTMLVKHGYQIIAMKADPELSANNRLELSKNI
jgi:ribosomal protein S18 acetylase RimI-like enzyme